MQGNRQDKWRSGSLGIWLTAAALSISILTVFGIISLLGYKGLQYFWPENVYEWQLADGKKVLGEIRDETSAGGVRTLVKQGDRDYFGVDFVWINAADVVKRSIPADVMALERVEWGTLYAYLIEPSLEEFTAKLNHTNSLREQLNSLEKKQIGDVNAAIENNRLYTRKLTANNALTVDKKAQLDNEIANLNARYQILNQSMDALNTALNQDTAKLRLSDGQEVSINFSKILNFYYPNKLSFGAKLQHFFVQIGRFLTEDPREANTEGGVFPAIFGTVVMVFLMSILVTPFAVVAAIYLHEYAKQGIAARLVRIAVTNLAGVPSVVYGVFGLGLFVYICGGYLDQWFFAERLPAPTFGTPGLLWASLTLALLTAPVVIVATEEGLARIPRTLREGSYALGATHFETLRHIILPVASPAFLTGLILAIARAAGEVAPLMLVGVVKLAPELPIDGQFPYLHLDRKFMHLGFHIYDVGFQSPNIEAARPLVFATALLLVLVIIILNLSAIIIRNRLREKFSVYS